MTRKSQLQLKKSRLFLERNTNLSPSGINNAVACSARGSADVKYHNGGLTPHSLLLFCTVLNQSTSPSGQSHRRQKYESTSTVKTKENSPAESPHHTILKNDTRLDSSMFSTNGANSTTVSARNTTVANVKRNTLRCNLSYSIIAKRRKQNQQPTQKRRRRKKQQSSSRPYPQVEPHRNEHQRQRVHIWKRSTHVEQQVELAGADQQQEAAHVPPEAHPHAITEEDEPA
ncbi:unnamed protein product [Phytophthora fragariaefolia]|uniref:Unnamed protein product n=1 Tax=Phytophthora fragariaefolia TaxID=1490495 RepID=A0A9W6YDN5_9STRA|nr:unnamed protein product [Phytophthora fragariaefolia]